MRRAAFAVALSLVALAGCGGHVRHAAPAQPVVHHRQHARPPAVVAGSRDEPVPILMFHAIGAAPPNAPFAALYDPSAEFAAQIHWLALRGYVAVTMRRVYDHWRHGTVLPRRPVVLTFDDGYPGDVTTAMPVLRRLHWPGVLNLQVGNLVPARVRELVRAGWEIDAHTFTHPNLTRVDASRLRYEVSGSRAWIRRMFDVPADFFAYPGGRYDAATLAAARAAGYAGAETTTEGYASPREGLFTLRRIRVDASDGVAGLARKLGDRL